MHENLVEILIRLYDDFLNLGIEEDLTDLTSDNEVGFIHFYPSHGRKLMRNELFTVSLIFYSKRYSNEGISERFHNYICYCMF